MHSGHFIERCHVCGTVISQCRCMDCSKMIILGTCSKCTTGPKEKPMHKIVVIDGNGATTEYITEDYSLNNNVLRIATSEGDQTLINLRADVWTSITIKRLPQ